MSSSSVVRSFGSAEDRNKSHRRKMEDAQAQHSPFTLAAPHDAVSAALFTLFDGHSGRDAALFCATHAHTHVSAALSVLSASELADGDKLAAALAAAFQSLNDALASATPEIPPHQGCTAVMALVLRVGDERKLVVGNAGDARVLLLGSGEGADAARFLTVDHVASDATEAARVKAAGGFISNDRVNGQLEVTRSIGDQLMKAYVVATPHTSVVTLSADTTHLVLGCDGIWDVLDGSFVRQVLSDPKHAEQDANGLSKLVVTWALQKGSTDNLSAQVILL
jgi:serine/threonine protein phosphatase PrpC